MSNNTTSDILIAGAFAAFSVDLLVYPLDTLKTRLQSPDYKRLYINGSTNTIKKAALFRGLYQGVGSVIIATLPSSGAFFTTYEAVKSTLIKHNPTLSSHSAPLLPQPLIHSLASSIGELVSCAILTPAEVIKQNAQMVSSSSTSPTSLSTSATVQVMKKFRRNPLVLFRGYTALAGRNLPFTALQFPMFEKLKTFIRERRQARGALSDTLLEGAMITAVSAGTAGSVAAVLTTPVDVVKTRIMLGAISESATTAAREAQQGKGAVDTVVKSAKTGKEKMVGAANVTLRGENGAIVDSVGKTFREKALGHGKRKSGLTIAREIVAQDGIKGLWRGGALRAIWTMLGSGLYLGVYESGRVYLARRRVMNVDASDME